MGKDIETRSHLIGFQEEIARAKNSSSDDFFGWFNNAKDTETAFITGAWDFSNHFVLEASKYIKEPETSSVLEVGHGGGRLLLAASRYFRKAYGVDIHNENDLVLRELASRGAKNIELTRSPDGKSIPLGNGSVDLVYSLIVLQHVEKIDIFKSYLEEIHRVLNKGGIAILYFGRRRGFSFGRTSRALCVLDRLLEPYCLPKGYREKRSRVNEVNLIVSSHYAARLCKKLGFKIEKRLISQRKPRNNKTVFGGQHGFVLLKQ